MAPDMMTEEELASCYGPGGENETSLPLLDEMLQLRVAVAVAKHGASYDEDTGAEFPVEAEASPVKHISPPGMVTPYPSDTPRIPVPVPAPAPVDVTPVPVVTPMPAPVVTASKLGIGGVLLLGGIAALCGYAVARSWK
jgi:hypothetical protein